MNRRGFLGGLSAILASGFAPAAMSARAISSDSMTPALIRIYSGDIQLDTNWMTR